jgi:hypothetical protein
MKLSCRRAKRRLVAGKVSRFYASVDGEIQSLFLLMAAQNYETKAEAISRAMMHYIETRGKLVNDKEQNDDKK